MHELGTVFYVIQEVEKVVEENHLTQVASVTLEVTFTITPERRARICGVTACTMAIVPTKPLQQLASYLVVLTNGIKDNAGNDADAVAEPSEEDEEA